MTTEDEFDRIARIMDARNAATRQLLDEADKINKSTTKLLMFVAVMLVVAGVILTVKAVGF